MYLERAVMFLEKILIIKGRKNAVPLNNWELDFIATICRIAASGKMVELSESQTNSLMSIYFKHVVMNKCWKMIRINPFKCTHCKDGVVEDSVGPCRCKECDGKGYVKQDKLKEVVCPNNCVNGMINDETGSNTCPKCGGKGTIKIVTKK